VISVALGVRKDLVDRAHASGSTFVEQVHTVEQAERAADAGADAIIAQGGEAGGFGGTISTMALVPEVVERDRERIVRPLVEGAQVALRDQLR
jgi:enoyl-[acyl-carrier protein] reductase II